MKEINLVEVFVIFCKANDKFYKSWLTDFELVFVDGKAMDIDEFEDIFEVHDEDIKLTSDTILFCFTLISASFLTVYSSGMDCDVAELSAGEIYGDYLGKLATMAEDIINDAKERGLDIEGDTCRFVTAWEWNGWEDSYYKEFESEWSLLGMVDLKDIKGIVK